MNNLYGERGKGPRPLQNDTYRASEKVRGRKRALLRLSDFMSVSWGCNLAGLGKGESRPSTLTAIGIETHSVGRADFGC